MSESWAIYDRLLEEIPAQSKVESCLVGYTWTAVDAGGMGLAMTYRGGASSEASRPPYSGRPLRDIAANLKSWSLREASLGMAAVNAHHNAPETVAGWVAKPLEALRSSGAFTSMLDEMSGKRVAVVGHFPGLEATAEICELTILERNPQRGDLPDFACEYVLANQDFVLITGTAITNKTLPRLLALSTNATVVLVGPSVPLVPWWFDIGVDVLAGAIVMDKSTVWRYCQEGGHRNVFDFGASMVDIRRSDLRPSLPLKKELQLHG